MPKWLTVDSENLAATIATLPAREDIDLTLSEHLVVEYYSKR